jgi:hypothetical protein
MTTIDGWTRVIADEAGLVRVGQDKFVEIATLRRAMQEQFGENSVTSIFGGQFYFRVKVAEKAIVTRH